MIDPLQDVMAEFGLTEMPHVETMDEVTELWADLEAETSRMSLDGEFDEDEYKEVMEEFGLLYVDYMLTPMELWGDLEADWSNKQPVYDALADAIAEAMDTATMEPLYIPS